VPFCFDLGRGDLQGLGYSYVYVDETTLRDGLVNDYPVLWDTGTFLMDQETVDNLKKYVESGGTYVLLQETGRHTYTQRDAWPITQLTGFEVESIRPMDGTLSIMTEQNLLPGLEGKAYYNRGKSIDYSDYNYADKCIALKPVAAGTQVIARYDDGAIAIGMRQLGKGRVIVLGSPFWRDSYDKEGIWWSGKKQNDFLQSIFKGLGIEPLATADTTRVWREHYLATNGTEEFLILHNPYDEPVTFSTTWKTVYPAGQLYDPKNNQKIPCKVQGRSVTLDGLTLTGRETLIVATQPHKSAKQAVEDWFDVLSKYWRPSEPGVILSRPDLPVYELRLANKLKGKILRQSEIADLPKVPNDMKHGDCQSPEILADNPDQNRHCVFEVKFTTPTGWREQDQVSLYIRSMTIGIGNIIGPIDAWVNGKKVLNQAKAAASGYNLLNGGAQVDISKYLSRESENTLVFMTGSYGFAGEVFIQMRPSPIDQISIAGQWQLQTDADSGLSPIQLPGEFNGLYAYTNFEVPNDWKNDHVFVNLDVNGNFDKFAINEKMIFHPVNFGNSHIKYMDVTPWIKFGKSNRLTLFTLSAMQRWAPGKLHLEQVQIQRIKSSLKVYKD
jgi:hypothetical protein